MSAITALSLVVGEVRTCLSCKGERVLVSPSFTTLEGKVYPEYRRTCIHCKGQGTFTAPDMKAIVDAVTTSRGCIEGKRKVRAAPDKKWDHHNTIEGGRTYYVWRLARFHGGKDVTMPVMAGLAIYGDSFSKELEALSDYVAKKFFGTDMAAALVWGRALGVI